MNEGLTHLSDAGHAHMVDVSAKEASKRIAVSEGKIRMNDAAYAALAKGENKKGDVFAAARIAGIMAVKKTQDLIPLCHQIPIEQVAIELTTPEENVYVVRCTVTTTAKTGVEMESLTGVSIALLTMYDMLKAVDKGMEISDIHVVRKSGGKRGTYERSVRT